MPFIRWQNSPTERSPCSKVRKLASSCESAELGIAEELPLERHPGLSRGAAVGPDEVLKD